jgi:hypothetical protein
MMRMLVVGYCVGIRSAPEWVPAETLPSGRRGATDYMVDRIRRDLPIDGPLAPELSLVGQRMIDTARASAKAKRTLALLP